MIMNTNNRIEFARKSLLGVSIGDAFGDSFFGNASYIDECIKLKSIPATKWEFTDDTIMSIAVFEELEAIGDIDQETFINKICLNHNKDVNRGYGATARKIIREISEGGDWKQIANAAFDGQGSMGNGAAMRVNPIGAYYFDNLDKVKELAIKSSLVTHTNNEAIVGAIAVAVATAIATKMTIEKKNIKPIEFIDSILLEIPDSDTKSKIAKSKSLSYAYHIETIKSILGNGVKMTAQDTVPFVIWCSAYNLKDFESGIWKAVSILGDRDTICAMVGGILIMSSEYSKIPKEWIDNVEDFDVSIFRTKNK